MELRRNAIKSTYSLRSSFCYYCYSTYNMLSMAQQTADQSYTASHVFTDLNQLGTIAGCVHPALLLPAGMMSKACCSASQYCTVQAEGIDINKQFTMYNLEMKLTSAINFHKQADQYGVNNSIETIYRQWHTATEWALPTLTSRKQHQLTASRCGRHDGSNPLVFAGTFTSICKVNNWY